jgi:hypothetical protein
MVDRLKDTFIGDQAYGKNLHTPAIDLEIGGQMGHHTLFENMYANTAYVSRNLICVLVQAPKGFQYFDNSAKMIGALKILVEMHARSWEGLQAGLTVEFTENAVDGSGQMQQDISNVTRARSTPTSVFLEKPGKPIRWFLETFITGLGMDPITKIPNIVTLNNGDRPTDMLSDVTGATMMFFEPDPTFTYPEEAWLCTNMFPNTTGDVVGRRDLTAAGQNQEITVEWSAVTQHGVGVMNFAQKIMNSMNLAGTNPNLEDAFITAITADVAAITEGYVESVNQLSASAVSSNA